MAPETVLTVLDKTVGFFGEKGVAEARRSAELLLCRALSCTRIDLYLRFDKPLLPAELEAYRTLVRRRLRREPVQYILGTTEFYGLDFEITPAVLVPRPETEHLVERAIELARAHAEGDFTVLDIGTGSGNIAVAVRKHVPAGHVLAIDVSAEALAVAQRNAARHGLNGAIRFENIDAFGDGLTALGERFDLLLSNPPYVTSAEFDELQPEIRDFEPRIAVTDGGDGLSFHRRIAALATALLAPGGTVLVEIGFGQAEAVKKIFTEAGLGIVAVIPDYAGHERVIESRIETGSGIPKLAQS